MREATVYDEDVRRNDEMRKRLAGEPYPSASANLGKAVPVDYAGASCGPMTTSPVSERLTLQNIEDAMNYQPWERDQQDAGQLVKEALTAAAKAILRSVPDSAFRSVALRNIIDARMNANAAISFRGRF